MIEWRDKRCEESDESQGIMVKRRSTPQCLISGLSGILGKLGSVQPQYSATRYWLQLSTQPCMHSSVFVCLLGQGRVNVGGVVAVEDGLAGAWLAACVPVPPVRLVDELVGERDGRLQGQRQREPVDLCERSTPSINRREEVETGFVIPAYYRPLLNSLQTKI